MTCPHLVTHGDYWCQAIGRLFMADMQRLGGFCISKSHLECTFYKTAEKGDSFF